MLGNKADRAAAHSRNVAVVSAAVKPMCLRTGLLECNTVKLSDSSVCFIVVIVTADKPSLSSLLLCSVLMTPASRVF